MKKIKEKEFINNSLNKIIVQNFGHKGFSLCNVAIIMIIIVGLISILSSIQLLCKIPLNIPFALLATFVSFVFFVYKGLF